MSSDSDPGLCKTHNYYAQLQGEMTVTGLPWCDFVVWTANATCPTPACDDATNEVCENGYCKIRNVYSGPNPNKDSSTFHSCCSYKCINRGYRKEYQHNYQTPTTTTAPSIPAVPTSASIKDTGKSSSTTTKPQQRQQHLPFLLFLQVHQQGIQERVAAQLPNPNNDSSTFHSCCSYKCINRGCRKE
ncbi:hypothetical protein MAR_012631 [Mya arenaria]|uniref:Uncharacterized protein n=1 Tax=Mya arenaria TaxID=6604 RepID=A0ABY7FZ53_MYAAR|nr:hypothetical protein MAR_012631 [Mya arenaria]